ncbi:MAG: hypothetical protein KGJ79_17445 [Alphaproteobacteria bacterium]|nr:hypothetical protein [Alphaproteobacteria bacterium]MDE2493200.1 hypothetical protein [Alphaproteobacteria bacterium]
MISPRSSTPTARLPGGAIDCFVAFERAEKAARPQIKGMAHLVRLYGARLEKVLDLAKDHPELLRTIGETGDVAAQVVHAAREEMAMSADDVVLRRTGIGQLGRPLSHTFIEVAKLMANDFD